MSLRKLNFALSMMSVFAITQFTTYVALASDDACMDHSARIVERERKVAEIEKRLGQVPTVGLGQMVRHSDGSVHRMTHAEAVSYCSARGGLPTAKQLALLLNTKGLSDKPLQGFPKYSPKNETPFYYSHASYERPEGDEGVEWFWSSSLHPGDDDLAFVFLGGVCNSVSAFRSLSNASRCAGR